VRQCFVVLLVCWFAGLLVCWFVGLLVCWFDSMIKIVLLKTNYTWATCAAMYVASPDLQA
jgi:hypothetical protein